jgi:predicted transcriptional regulator
MDKITANRLSKLAPTIQKFLDLHPDEQAWLYPLLGRAERRAILILECIQDNYMSYEEIAYETDSNTNTVKQILYALSEGGINFDVNKSGKWATPKGGRNRKITRIE